MIRKLFLISVILGFSTLIVQSQSFVRSSDLFTRRDENPNAAQLNIIQDPALDTLISRYILGYKNLEEKNGPPVWKDSGFRYTAVPTEMPKKNQVKQMPSF